MGCLSGHVYYTTRIFGFGTRREVAPSVAVRYFEVVSVCCLLQGCEEGGGEARHVVLVDAAPRDTRGRRTCYCAACAACCCCCWSCRVAW